MAKTKEIKKIYKWVSHFSVIINKIKNNNKIQKLYVLKNIFGIGNNII